VISASSLAGGFEGTIDFDWVPNPLVYANAIKAIERNLDNFAVPLAASRQIAQGDIAERFETKTDPSGMNWEPWADSYTERAESENVGGILEKTGRLREAATSRENFLIADVPGYHALSVKQRYMPDYWVFHQQPDNPNSGKIPQRAFLGLSDEAQAEVLGVFDTWFIQTTNAFHVTRSGTIQTRVPTGRGMETRFGPLVGRG
jgi:phage gpG-like protein